MSGHDYETMAYKSLEWLVKGMIPFLGITVVPADPEAGKTWTCYHLACCAVAGGKFLSEYPVRQVSSVLIFDAESEHDEIQRRLTSVKGGLREQGVEVDSSRIHICREKLRIDNADDREAMIEAIRDKGAELAVVDPLFRYTSHDLDRNDAGAMTRIMDCFDEIRQATGAAIIVTHHQRKPALHASNSPLAAMHGSVAIGAGANSVLRLSRRFGGNVVRMDIGKCRADEVSRKPVYYRVEKVSDRCTVFSVTREEKDVKPARTAEDVLSFATEMIAAHAEPVTIAGSEVYALSKTGLEDLAEEAGYGKRAVIDALNGEAKKADGLVRRFVQDKQAYFVLRAKAIELLAA